MRFADLGALVAALLALVWTVVVIALGAPRSDVSVARLQRPSAYVGGVGAALLVGQAAVVDAVEDGSAVARWDRPVLEWFVNHRDAALTAVFRTVSAVGGTVGMTVLASTAVVLLVVRHRRVHATAVAVAALGAAALNSGFKQLYERARPPLAEQLTPETTFALPSGHTVGSTAVLGVLAMVGVLLLHRAVWRVAAVVAAGAGALIIGLSRLYLGVHWLTDVLTGWLLGGAWLAMCTAALLAYLARQRSSGNREGVPAVEATPSSLGAQTT
jgi:membrane-associated phospholipid phosphatase